MTSEFAAFLSLPSTSGLPQLAGWTVDSGWPWWHWCRTGLCSLICQSDINGRRGHHSREWEGLYNSFVATAFLCLFTAWLH